MMRALMAGEVVDPAPGLRGTCPVCGGAVIAKCGAIVTPHWAHQAGGDCDPWSEPESEWHRKWKGWYLDHGALVEVTIGRHRADVVTNGAVLELQHSSIAILDARARERFYGRMAWLFDMTDPERFDRVHFGKRGFWWKRGSRVQATLSRPTYWHTPDRQVWRVRLTTKPTERGVRVLGQVLNRYTEDTFLALTAPRSLQGVVADG